MKHSRAYSSTGSRRIYVVAALVLLAACDQSGWETHRSKDPMTDRVFSYSSVAAENGPWRFTIECEQGHPEPFAAFEGLSTLGLTNRAVTGDYRVDSNPPRPINIGYYGGVLGFAPFEQKRFFQAIRGADKLAVKISTGYPVMVFDISGVDEALKTACG